MLTPRLRRVISLAALLFGGGVADAQTVSLDGAWGFAVDSAGAFTLGDVVERAHWREADVPHAWQAQFADLRAYHGVAWYRRTFEAPALGPDETALLHFGAVDYLAEVYVNGERVGQHEGGFTPFRFDVGPLLRKGTNDVVLRVVEPDIAPRGTEGLIFEEVPHGKQSWYVNVGGIWQSVRLDVRPKRYVESARITAGIGGSVRVDVTLAGEGRAPLALRVLDADGREVLRDTVQPEPSARDAVFEGHVETSALWSPDAPNLYTAEVTLGEDRITERFGFREIATRDGRIWLNGAPFYMIGALDQAFYPGTVYTPPSEGFLRDQMRKAKALGLNTLRMHVKVPDPRYYEIADEEGLLVWIDLPNHWTFTPEAAERLVATFEEMLDRDWNHPSLVALSLINESWGVDLGEPEQRAWLLGFFERAKATVPGWLVVDNSACWDNFHLQTDLLDWHTYWAIPENRHRFDETVDAVAARADWLFSPHGDAREAGDEPILLSEFGSWGLPDVPADLPWWLEGGMDDIVPSIPSGVHERFRAYGYDDVFGTYSALAEASQRVQARSLQYQIEKLRRTPEIAGYVVTELTDLNWESNGLLDMDRNVKAGMGGLARLQHPDVIVPHPAKTAGWGGDVIDVEVWLSHFGPARPTEGAGEYGRGGCCYEWAERQRAMATGPTVLRWTVAGGATGTATVPPLAPGTVRRAASAAILLPEVGRPQLVRVAFRWEEEGSVIAQNEVELFAFPGIEPARAAVHDPDDRLAGAAPFVEADPTADVLVAAGLDARVMEHLAEGGRAIVFADSTTALPAGFPISVAYREAEDELYDGNWITSLNWVRPDRPPFDGVAFGPTLGFEAAELGLDHVIEGVPPGHFGDVLAGMFVGWVQMNAGYVVQMNVGPGRLLLVTMRPRSPDDPYAAHLVRALVDYARSDAFQPDLRWSP